MPKEETNVDVNFEKERIITKIKVSNDPLLLLNIRALIDDSETNDILKSYSDIDSHFYTGDDAGEPCQTRILHLPKKQILDKYENKMAMPVFIISMTMLILAGCIILLLTGGQEIGQFAFLSQVLFIIYSILWIFFFVDIAITFHLALKEKVVMHKGELTFRFFALLFPPLRIGSRSLTNSNYIWLPTWEWSKANYALFDQLRKSFSMPMIIIALLIIPVLIVEWKFYDLVTANFPNFNLDLWMQLVQAFIWIAFTFEFILMFSVTNEKVDYCKRNWIDLLIIFLPLISFFRTLRLIRLARLNHLARGYKMRGIIMKAKQGLVLADAIQSIIYPNPKIHIRTLHKAMVKNNREREELNRKIRSASLRLKTEKKAIKDA